jgi:bacterioferritin-associated ferredoxin
MIVCVCHRVSDRDIARVARSGCSSFDDLQAELRVATGCGACLECAQTTFSQHCTGAAHQACHAWPAQADGGRGAVAIADMACTAHG